MDITPPSSKLVNSNNMQNQENNSQVNSERYAVDDTISSFNENIDLLTLDDEELQVYNKRGWSYNLFVTKDSNGKVNTEDLSLLQEKFSELNSKNRQRTDNILADGSRVVEVNNKLVLIGGTFNEPIIHNVLVVNAQNETDVETIKEVIFSDAREYKQNKENYINICKLYESIIGQQQIRNYESADFSYYKGRRDSGERAVLPNSFKSYGYTKQFQERGRNNAETERGISDSVNKFDLRFAIDDTINDWSETDLLYITCNDYHYLHKEITALCSLHKAVIFKNIKV
jgi:hypothetical protein